MNKIDLIIDALEAKIHNLDYLELTNAALAAARELKALQPVCVITDNEAGQIYMQTEDGKPFFINRHVGAKLYALEVTK